MCSGSPERSRAEAKKALASAGALDSKAASAIFAESSTRTRHRSTPWANAAWGCCLEAALQSGVGSDIRKVGMNSNRISDGDHPTLLSSLSGDDRQGHASQSDEAISTQKQLKDEMSADLVDAPKAKEDCKTNHAALIAAEKRRSPVQQAEQA